jgi:hypothetical protein
MISTAAQLQAGRGQHRRPALLHGAVPDAPGGGVPGARGLPLRLALAQSVAVRSADVPLSPGTNFTKLLFDQKLLWKHFCLQIFG